MQGTETAFRPPLLARALLLAAVLALSGLAHADSSLDREISSIDLVGRGDPQGGLKRIEQQLAGGALSDDQRLLLSTLQGVLLSDQGLAKEAEAVARRLAALPHPDGHGAAALVRANIESQGGNLARSIQYADEAASRVRATADPRLRFRIESARGWALTELGQFPLALKRYQEAAEIAERSGNRALLLRAYNSRSSVFAQSGNIDKALSENERALSIAKQINDAYSITVVWVTRTVIMSMKGDPIAQIRASEQANAAARRSGSAMLLATTEMNLGDAYLRNGRYADALKVCLQAARTAQSVGDESGVAIALANAGQAEIRLGRISEGKAKIERALESSRRMAARTQLADLLGEYAETLEAVGDYKGALKAFHRQRKLNEEIHSIGAKRALLEVESQYQTERKQREIELLNQKNALQASELQNRALQQRIWWLAAGLLLCGLLVIGLLYRRVRDANARLAESNQQLKARGELDPLTQLFNRRHFMEYQAAQPTAAFSGTLYLIDIDHFKHINDQHGHATGDAVIIEVARRLRKATRDKDKLMRWGGEEFLVAAPAMPLEQAERLAARLLDSVGADAVISGGLTIPVRISIGFAAFPLQGAEVPIAWERASNLADLALYTAKHSGRNRACGIQALAAPSVAALEAIEQGFPQACEDGRVRIRLLPGHPCGDALNAQSIAPGL